MLARRLRSDVIHLHCTNSAAVVFLACLRWAKQPVVYTAHVVTPHEPVPLEGPIYRQIHKLSDLIVAHSEFDRRRLLDEFHTQAERVVVIPHGEYGFFQQRDAPPDRAAARRTLGIAPDEEVALFFGYIREYKGLDLLLEAWPAVCAARPQARLVVAGDPVQLSPARREELRAWSAKVGAVHRFEYIPFEDVSQYFSAADAVVMPYRHISQSGVLFLALSLGVPVVATRVGALPEMLEDGDNALLIPPESPGAISDALIRVLGSPELRERLSDGGRRLADQHSWQSIAERTERAFAQLVGRDRETS
jgi:glycosyltransferase involved in cell wall biosynthesis